MQKAKIKIVKYEKTQKIKGATAREYVHFRRDKLKKNKGEQKVNGRKKREMNEPETFENL